VVLGCCEASGLLHLTGEDGQVLTAAEALEQCREAAQGLGQRLGGEVVVSEQQQAEEAQTAAGSGVQQGAAAAAGAAGEASQQEAGSTCLPLPAVRVLWPAAWFWAAASWLGRRPQLWMAAFQRRSRGQAAGAGGPSRAHPGPPTPVGSGSAQPEQRPAAAAAQAKEGGAAGKAGQQVQVRWHTALLGFRPAALEQQYLLYKNACNRGADLLSLGLTAVVLAVALARFSSNGTVAYGAADAAATTAAAVAVAVAAGALAGPEAAASAAEASAPPAAAMAAPAVAAAAAAVAPGATFVFRWRVLRAVAAAAWWLSRRLPAQLMASPALEAAAALLVAALLAAPYVAMLSRPAWYARRRELLLLASGLAAKPLSIAGCWGVAPFSIIKRTFRSHAVFALFRASVNLPMVQQVGTTRKAGRPQGGARSVALGARRLAAAAGR
jgi:hypothetical protein